MEAKTIVKDLFDEAGITIGGSHVWDIQVHDERFYRRVMREGSLGLGESYMHGWWDCARLEEFLCRLVNARVQLKILNPTLLFRYPPLILQYGLLIKTLAEALVRNNQRREKALEVGQVHYDLGSDLFKAMLDKRIVYTCAYWKNASNVDEAQEAKLDLICRKLGIKRGMKVLDIGCGWGSFVKYAAEKYGAECVGINISREQVELARQLCAGLPIEIRLQNYEDVDTREKFDRIVSMGAFEHFGRKNHRGYMRIVSESLKDDGLSLLHTAGRKPFTGLPDLWALKYIFPNGMIPTESNIKNALGDGLFSVLDWHNWGSYHYYRTISSWRDNFERNWNTLKPKYADKMNGTFYRMWEYYLNLAAAAFKSEILEVLQLVLAKKEYQEKYTPVR